VGHRWAGKPLHRGSRAWPCFPAGGTTCQDGGSGVNPLQWGCSIFFSVSQDFRNAYNYNYSLNVEKGFGKSLLLQVGYVGSAAHHLLTTQDINQIPLNPFLANELLNPASTPVQVAAAQTALQASRPFFREIPRTSESSTRSIANGNSNYNSLQTVAKVREWQPVSAHSSRTRGAHALDDITAYRGTTPPEWPSSFKGNMGTVISIHATISPHC